MFQPAGSLQIIDRGLQMPQHHARVLVIDRHDDRGAAFQRTIMVVEPGQRGHGAQRVAAEQGKAEAKNGIPEADDGPGQGDGEEGDHDKIDE